MSRHKKTKSNSDLRGSTAERRAPPEVAARRWLRFHWDIAAAVVLLALMAVQMIRIAQLKSATMDEQHHIARGIVYLRTGDLRLGRFHPPLINMIGALPLAPDRRIVLPLDHPSWREGDLETFAHQFLWEVNPNGPDIVFRARLPIIALSLLLAGVIYAWARELYGRRAGLLALALFTLDPNVMAHGSLATNDLGMALFATLSLYAFWRWLRQPNWDRAVIAGVALGLAQASKYSAVFLIPALALIALTSWLIGPSEERGAQGAIRLLARLVLIGLIGAMTLWAVYGFEVGPLKGQGLSLPASRYFNEMQGTASRVEEGNPAFLLGSYSDTGWWYYFPVTFAVKTPLATLLLIAAALVYAWRQRAWREAMAFLIPALIYLAFSVASPLNIGYRHLIPMLPLLLIFVGQLAQIHLRSRSILAWGGAALIVWLALGTWRTFPHYLAYFNEIAGGPENGYKVLADSNLDWGQELIGLKKYMEREGIPSVKLSYFGTAHPGAYGITYEPLPGYPYNTYDGMLPMLMQPGPGVYAISATNLQGALFKNHDQYAWFRARKPDAVIGHSIFIYRLKARGTR